MGTAKQVHYDPVDASPVKSFFVTMLTRDIKLEEAILDLLDNCVDGILRTNGKKSGSDKPYKGFWAKISYDKGKFEIADNCGGIPWNLHGYAFRMGRAKDRPDDPAGTVGVYGIGMKRAIFKMGRQCVITTQSGGQGYEVEVRPGWIADEKDWYIPVKAAKHKMPEDGTRVLIENLYESIAGRFGADREDFTSVLERMVSTHYAFIIEKGFSVEINGELVKPKPTRLFFVEGRRHQAIQPFVFRSRIDGVDVFLAVGFTRSLPTEAEVASSQEENRYSSLDAGWTVVCNDRAVLYCERTELTGWGVFGIPQYHTQFIAISGIVEFRSDDASKLPTTTTKRGIDASSRLFLQVKNKMVEGMRIFVDYTNKWKGRVEESKKHIGEGKPMAFGQIKAKADANEIKLTRTIRTVPAGEQFRPSLPLPVKIPSSKRRISFVKDAGEVKIVAEYVLKDENANPSAVGEKCFDLIHREAKQ
jgi:hypothetical protein